MSNIIKGTSYYNPFSSQKTSPGLTVQTIFSSGSTYFEETEIERLERERKEKRELREKKLKRIFNGQKEKGGST